MHLYNLFFALSTVALQAVSGQDHRYKYSLTSGPNATYTYEQYIPITWDVTPFEIDRIRDNGELYLIYEDTGKRQYYGGMSMITRSYVPQFADVELEGCNKCHFEIDIKEGGQKFVTTLRTPSFIVLRREPYRQNANVYKMTKEAEAKTYLSTEAIQFDWVPDNDGLFVLPKMDVGIWYIVNEETRASWEYLRAYMNSNPLNLNLGNLGQVGCNKCYFELVVHPVMIRNQPSSMNASFVMQRFRSKTFAVKLGTQATVIAAKTTVAPVLPTGTVQPPSGTPVSPPTQPSQGSTSGNPVSPPSQSTQQESSKQSSSASKLYALLPVAFLAFFL